MNREEIIAKVKNITGINVPEVEEICHDWIDWVQEDICRRYDYSFLKGYKEFNTIAPYSNGTITISNGSEDVVGDSTLWTPQMQGRFLKIGNDLYRIAEIIDNENLKLEMPYDGDGDTDIEYGIYKIFYELADDFKKMIWLKQVVTPVRLISLNEIDAADYLPNEFTSAGIAKGYIFSGVENNKTIIRLIPIQLSSIKIYYCYKKILPSVNSTGAISLIPADWHMLFVYKLSQFIYHRNDNMGQKEQQMYAMYEEDIRKLIAEDMTKSKDKRTQMQDEIIEKTIPLARLPYS